MFADYERLVLIDYQRKKIQNILSSLLIHPTQARIRKECLRLCKGMLQNKDEKVIRDFFEEWDKTKPCLQIIDKCDVDRFKPLSNFLKGVTETTDHRNIQMLAWLIDFPDRPYVHGKKYELHEPIQEGVNPPEAVKGDNFNAYILNEEPHSVDIEIQENADGTNEIKDNEKSIKYGESLSGTGVTVRGSQLEVRQKKQFLKVTIVGVLLAVTGGGYWWWDKMQAKDIMPENGSCMYWADDHFQPIPCYQKIPNTLVVALDSIRVKNFKKITRPDTLTHQAIGHVWYSKINMKIEFFTADGEHPVVIGRRLKPITDYIIDKYIHPGMTQNQ